MDKTSVFQHLLTELIHACQQHWGKRLIGILQFGSTTRRLKPATDLDLFMIIDGLPKDRMKQHEEWDGIESELKPRLTELDQAGCHLDLSPILKTPEDLERFSTLYLDFPSQGRILFSRDGTLESFLDRIRRQMEATGVQRKQRGLLSYWVIRPGMKYNEEVSTDWIVPAKKPASISHIPFHLRQYIAEQDYSGYTAIDHASWRYIMRVGLAYFRKHAHRKYLDGLAETGISIDRIPRISEIDEKLRAFGWRAATVTGFIPPAVFLEMQAARILPIACDMRKLEHIDYTPAPDIVHEAAGHAPLIADRAYASYLGKFGEISRHVIFAKEDLDVYEAVLNLSEVKEDPRSTPEDIDRAQKHLDEISAKVTYVSEAQQLTRFAWWTTEYGLFKEGDRFLIYGAGLLSSIGESYDFLGDGVRKIPLTIDCIETGYDITKPQPQLFYTDDFRKLEQVIDELANRMAYKRGGIEGLQKAQRAATLTTTVLDSGLQISGVLTEYRPQDIRSIRSIRSIGNTPNSEWGVFFLKYAGPVQLSYQDKQIEGQGPSYHAMGFSSPLGRIKLDGLEKATSELTDQDLARLGFSGNRGSTLEFTSGILLEGVLKSIHRQDGRTLLLSFDACSIRLGQEDLFKPEWGTFDLACGERVISVFGGAADRSAYQKETGAPIGKPRPQKINITDENRDLIPLYARVLDIRETRASTELLAELPGLLERLDAHFPDDWLLRLEILELLVQWRLEPQLQEKLRQELARISRKSNTIETLINRGLALESEF